MDPQPATRLYAFGSNGCGQLGVAHLQDLSVPQRSRFCAEDKVPHSNELEDAQLCGDHISQIVAGGNHTLILTKSGKVYAAGNNGDGRCGLDSCEENVLQFTRIRCLDAMNITAVAATWEASFVVDARRRVLVFGTGCKGELGLGEGIVKSAVPSLSFDTSQVMGDAIEIVKISASMSHAIILLSNGSIYGWGTSRKGQLGEELKPLKLLWKPQLIDIDFKVRSVAIGREHSFLTGTHGERVFLGDRKYFVDESALLSLPAGDVTSGWSSMISLVKGQLFGIGRNDKGQLPPAGMPFVTQSAAGSEHALACTSDDTVLTWGWGEHGNCGSPLDEHGNVAGRFNIVRLDLEPGETIIGLAAGCATSFIWTLVGT